MMLSLDRCCSRCLPLPHTFTFLIVMLPPSPPPPHDDAFHTKRCIPITYRYIHDELNVLIECRLQEEHVMTMPYKQPPTPHLSQLLSVWLNPCQAHQPPLNLLQGKPQHLGGSKQGGTQPLGLNLQQQKGRAHDFAVRCLVALRAMLCDAFLNVCGCSDAACHSRTDCTVQLAPGSGTRYCKHRLGGGRMLIRSFLCCC
jgi:hypothetical protein